VNQQCKLKTGILVINLPRLSHFQDTDKTIISLSDSKTRNKLIENFY